MTSSYITTGRRARMILQLQRIQARLNALYETALSLSGTGVDSYSFDSGEGSQRTQRKNLKDVEETIRRLEATEEHIINELNRVGILSVKVRRKPC